MAFSTVPEPRHPLGGLKRLGTVMSSRRKSIAQPSGSFFSDKKGRSPFATFKRGDSRDMQIPESPSPGLERPDTAFTAQDSVAENARQPSESRDREGLSVASPIIQEPQFAAPATNGGPDQEAQAAPSVGISNVAPSEVCSTTPKNFQLEYGLTVGISRTWIRRVSQSDHRLLMISLVLSER